MTSRQSSCTSIFLKPKPGIKKNDKLFKVAAWKRCFEIAMCAYVKEAQAQELAACEAVVCSRGSAGCLPSASPCTLPLGLLQPIEQLQLWKKAGKP